MVYPAVKLPEVVSVAESLPAKLERIKQAYYRQRSASTDPVSNQGSLTAMIIPMRTSIQDVNTAYRKFEDEARKPVNPQRPPLCA